jgi:hypothetical protein
MTVAELIEVLKTKQQDAQVEHIVCKTDGEIVCCDVKTQAKAIMGMLKWFK